RSVPSSPRLHATSKCFSARSHQRVHFARPGKILLREPAFAVRAERQRHALVVDQDVGVMVGCLGVERQSYDEGDRVREAAERVLLADCLAVERPPVELRELLLNLRVAESLRHRESIQKKGLSPGWNQWG